MATNNGSRASRGSTSKSSRPAAGGGVAKGGDPAAGKIIGDGITFDDVLLLPRYSDVMPSQADTSTRLTPRIRLNIPLVSAPMDTVTESALAIALAQEGGVGVIHRNLPIEAQAREVSKVKRSANGVILDPITVGPNDTVGHARQLMREHNVSGFPVTEDGSDELRSHGRVVGILTKRDLKFVEDLNTPVRGVMTSSGLVTAAPGTTLEEAERILNRNKVEKLILVDKKGRLAGMITQRDIDRLSQFPKANLDARGRLRCGAACGVDQYDRVEALIAAEADFVVVDTSHGHSENVLRTVRTIKKKHDVEVIAGNVATAEGAQALVRAGADAIKAGIGPGSICTTRVVTGVGVPQLTAIFNSLRGVKAAGRDIAVIADGGIRMSGDIAKAIAAGASCVMLGSLFAGLDESPGESVIFEGRRYKSYRGMGSAGAMEAGSADRYGQHKQGGAASGGTAGGTALQSGANDRFRKFVPEGVEGLVPYRGSLAEFVYQLVGGLRASMGYCGCGTIDEFRKHARFVRVTVASVVESHPHDIRITKEAPNYSHEALESRQR
ncbi:MAG: IMP dehydrogenase [Phycisphaeraceae bacterium]|nr:IMP dehydrogenase [Phycisphaeraceae bacterium]